MERILVALDGSPRSSAVLAEAVDLARRTGAKLWLYRGVGIPTEVPKIAFVLPPDELAGVMERNARESLEVYAKTVPKELLGGIRVSLAQPWQGVCDAAHSLEVDLIVVGSHGYGGLDRVLGTTAAKIVNHAEQSVLVVKGNPAGA